MGDKTIAIIFIIFCISFFTYFETKIEIIYQKSNKIQLIEKFFFTFTISRIMELSKTFA